MPDLEKVLKGLECAIGIRGRKDCDNCPYDYDFNCLGCDIVMRDALALLKEQEPGWISAKDRPPEDGEDVLAYCTDGEESRIVPVNYANGVWYDCVFNTVMIFKTITHWMPLPEPPKEVSNGE